MKPSWFSAFALFAALLATLADGCVATNQYPPVFVDPSFQQSPPSGLRLLPVVDARKEPRASLDLEREVRERFAGLVRNRGYKTELVSWLHSGPLPPLPRDSVSFEVTQKALIPYLPPGSTPIVIITLEETRNKSSVVNREGVALVSAWIFDAGTGKLLWMDRSSSSAMLVTGVDPVLTSASILFFNARLDALHACLDELNSSLPIPKS